MSIRLLPLRHVLTCLLASAVLVPLVTITSPSPPTAAAATQVVAKQGYRGETVKSIQRAVRVTVDGIYGPKTAAAVKVWQKAHGLTATGVVDTVAWTKMKPKPQLVGADVSWPQCPKGMGIPSRPTEGKKMPKASMKFLIIGLTNGPGFYTNPCLASQVAWAKRHHVHTAPYAFTTYPTSSQLKRYAKSGPYKGNSTTAKLKNTGYAQAQFNVANMRKAGLRAPFIWVDVEYSRSPAKWSSSRTRNKAVLDGVFAGYQAAGLKVGVYTSEEHWKNLIGKARYRVPEWRTVGPASKTKAMKKCSVRSVQGGKIVLAQWWIDDSNTNNSTDYNVLCPGYSSAANLKKFFTKY